MAPGATVKLTRSSALMPAKRTVTSRTASSGTSTPSRACRWVVTRPTESGACGYAGLRHVLHAVLLAGSGTEVEVADLVGAGEFLGFAGQRDPADLQHNGPRGHRQRHGRVLLDQQHRRTCLLYTSDAA